MFERNAVERGTDAGRKAVAVRITFDDGREVSGECAFADTRTLEEEINSAGQFLDFMPYTGARAFVAKASVVQMSRIDLPKGDQLVRAATFADAGDPYAILGVQRGSDAATIQTAYHRLAKIYHPDRFAGLDLPKEMAGYAGDMARRINEAYAMLIECEKDEALRRARAEAEANAPKTPYEAFRRQAAARYSTMQAPPRPETAQGASGPTSRAPASSSAGSPGPH
ncbi:MAG: J domain-containing protein [Pseudomonadota bacterium]